jgi:carbon starvation protein
LFNAYPSAATASLVYIALALLFGAYLYQFDLPFLPGTVAFVAAVFGGIFVGVNFPLAVAGDVAPAMEGVQPIVLFESGLPLLPSVLGSANIGGWIVVVMLYGLVASVLPVWVLLQPRDFLTSSLLYAGVGGTLIAVVVGTVMGAGGQLEVQLPAYTGFMGNGFGPLFPLLFVTIACGTISGFHSLVSSGTTAKQLNKESDARAIGYGAMLGEGLLATVAIVTVAVYGFSEGGGIGLALPNFASGGGLILNVGFGLPVALAAPFMGLVLVSFLLTSTDTAIRLGRYMFEELVGTPETTVQQTATNRYVNVAIQVVPAYLLVASGSWSDLWPLFGGANQTLAALALLVATVWLANWRDDKQLISTGGPMAVMFAITTTALLYKSLYELLYQRFIMGQWPESALVNGDPTLVTQLSTGLQIVLALVLVGLGLSLAYMGVQNVQKERGADVVATDGGEPGDD